MAKPKICQGPVPFIDTKYDCECVVTCEEMNELRDVVNNQQLLITNMINSFQEHTKMYTDNLVPGDTGVVVTNTATVRRIGDIVHLNGLMTFDLSATPFSDDASVENRIISDEKIHWATIPEGFRPMQHTVVAAEQASYGDTIADTRFTQDCRFSTNLLAEKSGNMYLRDNFTFVYHNSVGIKLADRIVMHLSASWVTQDAVPK